VTAALGCAHAGATSTDSKTTNDDTVAAQGDASSKDSKEQDRQRILAMKDHTLADLYKYKPEAKEIIEKAEGYAVFDTSGVFVVLYVGIAGRGVLIDKSNGEATYMTMARAGTGLGVGYEKSRYIIVFKSKSLLDTSEKAITGTCRCLELGEGSAAAEIRRICGQGRTLTRPRWTIRKQKGNHPVWLNPLIFMKNILGCNG
jgi:hypothetical protein